ncbi:sigma-70 family RNA polymerase sigma factor [Microtetraspora sp. AC03309]|uniref:RNA polymerase sigma factor n=1 Tax=Microtetraspora sp. AC03309 TaxID=2779376 RepID=UPI001E33BB62|nr:sigma-70 family RNA polymerase sigma factor [Microtetraspora sp. AC03309]MCC5578482.1 sigma-70 family RNA polymerase sigma factor [Microtetraspora sp. AC03309]
MEDLLRELAPQVLALLTRRYGHFNLAEEAVQEALLAAATQWPDQGLPDNPAGWMTTVATRRMTDLLRSEQARRRREQEEAFRALPADLLSPAADVPPAGDSDDTLLLLFLCCHPALNPPAQVALTLRAVGGLTTAEIARALLLPEATLAQRITRAKKRILEAGGRFRMPDDQDRARRLDVVLHVLYLIFNEGYTATAGESLHRGELCTEAIRLARMVHRLLPDVPEVSGLLAEMLLTDARRPARTGPDGELVPLAEQDRGRWNREMIDEGIALLTAVLPRKRPGPYQLQAAIAAVHAEAERFDDTDWAQIVALYQVLDRLADNPVVTLNRAVAVAMLNGPAAGLAVLETVADDQRMAGHHRLHAVRGHLREEAGDRAAAIADYRTAARLTTSLPERHYLLARAARLDTR